MASPAPALLGICRRLRELFGAKPRRFETRVVLARGERASRARSVAYDKYSPVGRKHIRGTTDTGSDARCAPLREGESKSSNPVDLWTALNTRVSTCEQEVRLREAAAREPRIRAGIARARRDAARGKSPAIDEDVAKHLASDRAFFRELMRTVDAWEAAARSVEAGVKACAADADAETAAAAQRALATMRETMAARVPPLRERANDAEELFEEFAGPPIRRALRF